MKMVMDISNRILAINFGKPVALENRLFRS